MINQKKIKKKHCNFLPFENLVMIRPEGVAKKNDIGARKIAINKWLCILRAALRVPLAQLNCRIKD